MATTFGILDVGDLTVTGDGASLIDLQNVVLPDGVYRICFCAASDTGCPPPQCSLSDYNSGCGIFTIACRPVNGAQITTMVTAPFTPNPMQAINTGTVNANLSFNSSAGCSPPAQVKIFGRIEGLSPAPFTLTLDSLIRPANTYYLKFWLYTTFT